MEAICSPKCQFLLDPHGVISQKAFVIVTSVKTSQKTEFFGSTKFHKDLFKDSKVDWVRGYTGTSTAWRSHKPTFSFQNKGNRLKIFKKETYHYNYF
jgi:hypothetical protein